MKFIFFFNEIHFFCSLKFNCFFIEIQMFLIWFLFFTKRAIKKVKNSLKFVFFEIWPDHDLTLEKHKIMTFCDFVALEDANDIYMVQIVRFCKTFLNLSVPHQNTQFYVKKSFLFLPKKGKNRGK